jgi:hypothetical protein
MFDILDWCMEHLVLPVIIALIVALVFVGLPALGYALWKDAHSPTFTLKKNEWACTQSHERPITTYVQSGKVLIPITSYERVCDTYERRP